MIVDDHDLVGYIFVNYLVNKISIMKIYKSNYIVNHVNIKFGKKYTIEYY